MLIHNYKFDDVSEGTSNGSPIVDAVGSLNGTVVTASSLGRPVGPVSTRARDLPGVTGERLVIPNNSDLDLTADRSVGIWTTVDAVSSTKRFVLGKFSGSGWYFNLDSGTQVLRFGVDDGPTLVLAASTLVPAAGETYLWIGTFNATTKEAILYSNGIGIASALNAALVPANVGNGVDLWVGENGGLTNWWDGRVHEIGFWDHVLTPKEVYDIYHGSNIVEEN